MGVRFVIGRAGVGKTAHCLAAIKDALGESAVDGPRLFFLVPEQASFQMERMLLDGPGPTAVHRAEVLSFRRLAYRVLTSCGDGGRTALSPAARAMTLRLLLGRHQSSLKYYRRAERFGGFIEQLGRTITEFIEESIEPDDLVATGDAADEDSVVARKLADLRLIYRAYLDALGDRLMDPSQYLDIALARLADCRWLLDAHVWVDGFAGFSRQEQRMLAALAGMANRMEITALIDPQYAADPAAATAATTELFAKTRRTMGELAEIFRDSGVGIEPPCVLGGPPGRFAKCQSLALLEKNLFQLSQVSASSPPGVEIVEAADRRTEVELAVSQIHSAVRRSDDPLRYRDIAIIVRDLEPYHALVSAALQARGIPFFIDRRRGIAHHPLVELLRGLIQLAAGDYAIEPVRLLLKCGFLRLDDDLADELENHVLAAGVTGRGKWTGDDWLLPARDRKEANQRLERVIQRINASRRDFVEQVDSCVGCIVQAPEATGTLWAKRFRDCFDRLAVDQQIETWAQEAVGEGELDQAEGHRQTWRDVSALIDDLEIALGDHPIDIAELAGIMDAALAQLTVGLTPPMLDQVLVSSIDRSRHPDIRMAIVLGLNEGSFPSVPVEDSILNDEDRLALDHRGIRLGVSRRQRILEESLLLYVAVTRPSESLMLSYATADTDGKPLRASHYLPALLAACGMDKPRRVEDPFHARQDWAVLTDRDLAGRLADEFRRRPKVSEDDTVLRRHWNDVYEAVRSDQAMTPALRGALVALTEDNVASLDDANARASASDPLVASISQLETYAACAFKHFTQYRLRLRERELSQLASVDIGTIHHAILEQFICRLAERGESVVDIDENGLLERLTESCEYVKDLLPLSADLSCARDRYLMQRSERVLARVLGAQRNVWRAGAFRPKAAEQKFGFSQPGSLGAVEITTPNGHRLHLRGVIDRVDLAEVADDLLGIVVDYKSTPDKKLDLSEVYYGLSLQLPGYLLALAQRGQTLAGRPIKPAGALYVSLQSGYKRVDHPRDAGPTRGRGSAHAPRGLVDITALPALEPGGKLEGWSEHYSIFINKSGALGFKDFSDGVEHQDFTRLLRHAERKLGELADQVIDGRIVVEPYRLGTFSPCSWCAFGGVCRFEARHGRVRSLSTMKKTEVFAQLEREERASDE